MKILKSYKFRLDPTEDQIAMLKQHGGNSRFVWNKLLEFSNDLKKGTDKYPTQSQLQKQIIQIKTLNDFVKLSHSQPIQINAMRLSDTISRAFAPEMIAERNIEIAKANTLKDENIKAMALKNAFEFGFPKFKSRSKSNDSLFYPQNFIIKKTRIYFPKLKWINFIKHREMEGKPLSVTITKDGNQYYVSIPCEIEIKEKDIIPKIEIDKANIAGIDLGITDFAVLSDKTTIKNPRTLKKYLKKIKRESKNLKRKELKDTEKKTFDNKIIKESSKNRIKQIEKNQIIHRKIRNIRKDFLHKTTHHIITKYDGVILESLDIKEMLKKNSSAMNRSISDVSWYEFCRQLEYKAEWKNKYFCKIDQYYPSTQLCNNCKHQMKLSLNERMYVCPNCGAVCGRDYNASLNIRDEGIRIIKNTLATKGIEGVKTFEVCGQTAIAGWMKQKKRRFQQATAKAVLVA
jgi:putative transposase